ncbi:hypothetical protein D3C87_1469800 [compost metagenome]
MALSDQPARQIDDQDRVLGDNAHQHQRADQDRHCHAVSGGGKRQDAAGQGERQRQQDCQRLERIAEKHEQDREHCCEPKQRRPEKA